MPADTQNRYQMRSSFLGNLLLAISSSLRYLYRKYVSKSSPRPLPVRRNDVGIRHSSGGNFHM